MQLDLFGNTDKEAVVVSTNLKVCNRCRKSLSLDRYHYARHQTCGLQPLCKDCCSAYSRDLRYVHSIAPKRDYACNCCGYESDKLQLDHDRHTLQFRGWLCSKCNTGIGKLGDNIQGLNKALAYLRKVEDNQ